MNSLRILILVAWVAWVASIAGCSAAKRVAGAPEGIQAEADRPAEFSYRSRVRHPESAEISSVRALFSQPGAPELQALEKCDFDYRVETMLSRSIEELLTTLPEHVRSDPERYHWCFYAKLLKLEDDVSRMQAEGPAAQRKHILTRYRFFIYLARIFEVDLDDPRYLDFARQNYRRLMDQIPE